MSLPPSIKPDLHNSLQWHLAMKRRRGEGELHKIWKMDNIIKKNHLKLAYNDFCALLDSLYGSDCYNEDFFLGYQFSEFYTFYFQEYCPTPMDDPPPSTGP